MEMNQYDGSMADSGRKLLRLGDELTIRYDPAAPYRMEAGGAMALFLPIMFMGMGGLFVVIGIIWLRFFRVRREPENPWAGPQY